MLKLSNAEHRTRLRLYKQGLNDYEVASRLNINESTIRRWRNVNGLKPNHEPQISVPMERALTGSQCQQMKRFFSCLTTYADRYPGRKIDVLMFAREYREGVGAIG